MDEFDEAQRLIGLLSERLMAGGMKLAAAESCTGGLIAKLCTDRPGSSRWFMGAVIAYDNALKTSLLDVPEETIAAHGAVSGPVVEAMALGAIKRLGADCSVAVSGIAGPDGGSPDKPVGLVWTGAAVCAGKPSANGPKQARRALRFSGSRHEVRASAALAALETLAGLLDVYQS